MEISTSGRVIGPDDHICVNIHCLSILLGPAHQSGLEKFQTVVHGFLNGNPWKIIVHALFAGHQEVGDFFIITLINIGKITDLSGIFTG